MPDPRDSLAAKQARMRMGYPTGGASPDQHTAAQELVRLVLGDTQVPTPPFGGFFEAPQTLRNQEGIDPQIPAGFDLLTRRYPNATRKVGGLFEVPNTTDDTQGAYLPALGTLGVRTKPGRSYPDIISTMAHELAHAMGLADQERPGQRFDNNRDMTAHDVGKAMNVIHSDINLPNPPKTKRK